MQIALSQIFATRQIGFVAKRFRLKPRRHPWLATRQSQRFVPRPGDRLLAGNEEPRLGAHLVTPRFAYAHHGIYVGGGAVVHYSAFAKHWRRGPVEATSLACFAQGRAIWVRPAQPTGLQGVDIVRRARSRLGEDRYRFFSNNCEHLSEWCVNREHRSPQAEHFLAQLRSAFDFMRLLKVTPLRGDDIRA